MSRQSRNNTLGLVYTSAYLTTDHDMELLVSSPQSHKAAKTMDGEPAKSQNGDNLHISRGALDLQGA